MNVGQLLEKQAEDNSAYIKQPPAKPTTYPRKPKKPKTVGEVINQRTKTTPPAPNRKNYSYDLSKEAASRETIDSPEIKEIFSLMVLNKRRARDKTGPHGKGMGPGKGKGCSE